VTINFSNYILYRGVRKSKRKEMSVICLLFSGPERKQYSARDLNTYRFSKGTGQLSSIQNILLYVSC